MVHTTATFVELGSITKGRLTAFGVATTLRGSVL